MRRFAAIGEAMIELAEPQPRALTMSFAGDSINTSVYLARLLPATPMQIHYITLLGRDPYSDQMLLDWQREGIHIDHIQRLPHKLPGLYLIRTDATGERSFYFYRSASAAREMFSTEHATALEPILLTMDYLYLSSITLAILDDDKYHRLLTILKRAHKKGIPIIFDTNYRPSLWPTLLVAQERIKEVLRLVKISLVTFDDEQALFQDKTPEDCAERHHSWGVTEVVVKQGQSPCLISLDGDQVQLSSERVERVVDTTSAGDSFNAGYLSGRLQDKAPMEAARIGHQLAATVIQYPGAIIPRQAMPIF